MSDNKSTNIDHPPSGLWAMQLWWGQARDQTNVSGNAKHKPHLNMSYIRI